MANPAMFFVLALYLQIGLQYSPLAAGLTFAPAPIGFFLAATVSGRMVRLLGRRLILLAIVMKAGAWTLIGLLVIRDGASLHGLTLLPLMLIEGAGAGWTSPPLIGISLAGVQGRDAGSAAGVFTTAQQIAGALGVARIGVVFFGVLTSHAPAVSTDLAPELRARLADTLSEPALATTIADFRRCADDRARSSDPAVTPASCEVATLQASDPAVAPAIAEVLQRANALNYAHAYVVALYCTVGLLVFAFAAALALPAHQRGQAGTPLSAE
jgi:hypothetical protein